MMSSYSKNFLNLIRAIRAYQWVKNFLVFVPVLASQQISNEIFIKSLISFIVFCLISSCAYITNDIFDLKNDKAHPKKKYRPFASGAITVNHGIFVSATMFVAGVFAAFYVNFWFLFTVLTYFILTFAYSIYLKKKVIIDICVLGSLYTIRIIAGGIATDIQISFWLLAFSIFIFLSLAAVKRMAELVDLKKRKKIIIPGRGYNINDLGIVSMIAVSSGFLSILIIGLYTNSPQVLDLYSNPWTLWVGNGIMLYWLTRIIFVAHRGDINDDPIIYALKDNISRLTLLIVILLILINFIL